MLALLRFGVRQPVLVLVMAALIASCALAGLAGALTGLATICVLVLLVARGPRGLMLVLTWRRVAGARGFAMPDGRIAFPAVRRRRAGLVLQVRVPVGRCVDDVIGLAPAVSAATGRAVHPIQSGSFSRVDLLVIMKDALVEREISDVSDLPVVADDLSAVPLGVTESGEVWRCPLDGGSIVLGGEPGGGKSGIIAALLSALSAPGGGGDAWATARSIQIVAVDLKEGVELSAWEPRCAAFACDQQSALAVLEQVDRIRAARMEGLRRVGMTSVSRYGYSAELPMIVVVIDEAAELFAAESPAKEDKDRAAALLRITSRLVRLGRSSSIVLLLATQKPTSDALPSIISNAASTRVATRCTTREQARAVLGDSESLVSPTSIRRDQRGMAVAETGSGLQLVRAPFITEEVRRAIAESAAHLARPLDELMPKDSDWRVAA